MTNPAMYLFANKGLGMSPGKLAAQIAHAAVEAFRASPDSAREAWYLGGHYKKLVMQARDADHLTTIARYLTDRGFTVLHIIDEGMTEIPPHTLTALGVAIVDKDDPHTAATFSTFELYQDPTPHSQMWPATGFAGFTN